MAYATGTLGDFKIYQDEYYSGLIEGIDQSVQVLNESAGGAIRVLTQNTLGQFEKRSFFQNTDNLVIDRDPTDTSELTAKKLTQGEVKDILKNYTIGPVRNTLDGFRKMAQNPSVMSFVLGVQQGEQLALEFLNNGLASLVASIGSEAAMVWDNTVAANSARTGGTTISHRAMNRAAGLFGDRRAALRAIVGPSAVATELFDNQLTEKLGEVSGSLVYGASVGTLGLPMWVTDSPALSFEDALDGNKLKHRVLMLTENALILQQQDYMDMHSEIEGGRANLTAFYQAESAYLLRVKGFSYIGTEAPTAGELADGANWDYVYASLKDGPGVMLVVNDVENTGT